jgi:hypothetical protein
MLFLPHPVMIQLKLPVTEPVLFLRWMGAAFLGLATMYGFGLARAYRGDDVTDVLVIAVVTNGMSGAIVWRYALGGALAAWPQATRNVLYGAGGLLTIMALALLGTGFGHGH